MEIYSVPVTKAKLDKIPETERAFYIHILHIRNEVGVLIKLLSWSMNNASDIIVNSAMLEAIEPGDYKAAAVKLGKEVMAISLKFMSFCDGCWGFMLENYLGKNADELDAEKIEVPDVQKRSEIRLPFFFA